MQFPRAPNNLKCEIIFNKFNRYSLVYVQGFIGLSGQKEAEF